MFIRFLRHVRQQPKTVRDQYALAISTVFTSVVALIWFFNNFWMQGGENPKNNDNLATESSAPFASVLKQAKEQWQGVKNTITNNASSSTQTAAAIDSVKVNSSTDPRNIKLSDEDASIISEQQKNASNTNWRISSSSVGEPVYQEVQIVTVSSTKATTTSE